MKTSFQRLFVILLLGFLLRFTASWFGLPHLYHADEPIVVNHALAYGAGDLNPHFFKIPPLLSYLLFGVYGMVYALGHFTGRFADSHAFEVFFYADPSLFYFTARFIFGVLAGTLTLLVFYRLVARYFSSLTALFGAAFLAVNFLHVRDSHYIYADIPLILAMLCAFSVFFRALEKPGFIAHLGCGAMIGLAAAIKYNGAALLIPYAFILRKESGPKKTFSYGLPAALAALGIFTLLNPFAFLDFHFFSAELRNQALSNSGVPWFHHLRYSLAGAAGIPLLILAFSGILGIYPAFDTKKTAFALFVMTYYGVLVFAGQPYDRYVLPLIPFLIFFGAEFISSMGERGGLFSSVLVPFCFLAVFVPNLAKSVLFDRLMLLPDTRTLAREWILKNIPSETPMALDWDFYMPRLSFSKKQVQEKLRDIESTPGNFSSAQKRKLDFLSAPGQPQGYDLYFLAQDPTKQRFLFASPLIEYDLTALRSKGIQYVVIVRLMHEPGPSAFYEQLTRESQKMAEFTPYRNQLQKYPYDEHPLTGGPFLWKELLARTRNGQPLEIHKIA